MSRKRTKDWLKANPERAKQNHVKFLKNHPDYNKNKSRIYQKFKRKTDLNFKILANLRTRLCDFVNKKNKSKKTIELLGCLIDELKQYLKNKFKPGMSWDNYGRGDNGKGMKEWHIDHIRPCASFDLTDPKQQQECFHYTNLQPLWAIDNIKKGKKYEY